MKICAAISKQSQLLLAALLINWSSIAQQPLYRQYTVKDGLPSNVAYRVFQDSQGFIWIGTDQGLAKFDGSKFEIYTTKDGLPDNEVFNTFEDNFHRLWIFAYTQKPCYILNGKVYNSQNDNICRQIAQTRLSFFKIFRNKNGQSCMGGESIGILGKNSFQLYKNELRFQGIAFHYFVHEGVEYVYSGNEICSIVNGKKKILRKEPVDCIYHSRGHLYYFSYDAVGRHYLCEDSLVRGAIIPYRKQSFSGAVYGMSELPDGNILCCTEHGTMIYDIRTGSIKSSNILPGKSSINTTIIDHEGNRWFSSSTDGLFMQLSGKPSIYNKVTGLADDNVIMLSVTSAGKLLAGYDQGHFSIIDREKIINRALPKENFKNRVKFIFPKSNDQFVIGCDRGIYTFDLTNNRSRRNIVEAIKAGQMVGDSCISAASGEAFIYRVKSSSMITIWKHRTTAITRGRDGTVWMGTLEGLYYHDGIAVKKFTGNKILSRSYITHIATMADGMLVISTSKSGLFLMDSMGIQNLTEQTGLISNNCKKTVVDSDQRIWLCTNNGLDKITLSGHQRFDIHHYSFLDGLPENRVNDIAVLNDTLYAATTEGIVVMSTSSKIKKTALPKLWIMAVQLGDTTINNPKSITLSFKQNNIQVLFAGISFAAGKDIQYKYLLKGGANDTLFTKGNTVNLSSLKPGNYQFLLWARIKGNPWTIKPESVLIRISPPFWGESWFIIMVVIAVLLSLYLYMRYKIKRIQIRAIRDAAKGKQIAELELQAVRAQINPHFLFNALNSIQNYYSNHDERSANHYLTSFAQFMRKTLTYSKAQWITLSDEIGMLQTYIDLEQMRFKHTFTYQLTSTGLDTDTLNVPTMLIQPYIENAINHGLRHLFGRAGHLSVKFEMRDDVLICLITDNGIGRAAAAAYNTATHQSAGMQINAQRISIINQLYSSIITLQIKDNEDTDKGTIVTITIPQNNQWRR